MVARMPRKKLFGAGLAVAVGFLLAIVVRPVNPVLLAQKTPAPDPTNSSVELVFPALREHSRVKLLASYQVDETGNGSRSTGAPSAIARMTIVGLDGEFAAGPWNTYTTELPVQVVADASPGLFFFLVETNLADWVPSGFTGGSGGEVMGARLPLAFDRTGSIAAGATAENFLGAHAPYAVHGETVLQHQAQSRGR
jgi:hypothetical protein